MLIDIDIFNDRHHCTGRFTQYRTEHCVTSRYPLHYAVHNINAMQCNVLCDSAESNYNTAYHKLT